MIEITNPMAPITKSPIAETLEIVLTSSMLGFFKSRQTRKYLLYCERNFRINLFVMLNEKFFCF